MDGRGNSSLQRSRFVAVLLQRLLLPLNLLAEAQWLVQVTEMVLLNDDASEHSRVLLGGVCCLALGSKL